MLENFLCGFDFMSKCKNKSTSSSDVSSEKPPITIEEIDCERRGYKLTHKTLGIGAYAKVKLAYVSPSKKAKHPCLRSDLENKEDNRVAIKIISKKNAPTEYLEKFFPREIDALNATCKHRNVITLYETFRSETKVYLVMEYAAKGDLLEFINSKTRKGQPLTEEKAKFLFRQLVLGVTHCHQRNVVHRDLKCENVLLDEHDLVKITDFGFATRYPTNKCKFLDTFCGSYAYAAPEILSACKYDGKLADIWSLGVILFAMTCGRLPYNDKSLKHLIEQTKKKITFPEKLNLSSELRDLIHGMLVWDAKSRMSLNEILFHPWLAMIKIRVQSSSSTRKIGECDKLIGTVGLEQTPRPLGMPRPQKQTRRSRVQSPAQFMVGTRRERENVTRKSAIPLGTWRPQTSTPEPSHASKINKDKNNNTVMKFLISGGGGYTATTLTKLTSDQRQEKLRAVHQASNFTSVRRPPQQKPGTSHVAGYQGNTMTSAAENRYYHAQKSGVYLKTFHTLYRCKKVRGDATKQLHEEKDFDKQQGTPLTSRNLDCNDQYNYNFPPVSDQSTKKEPTAQQRSSSSRRACAASRNGNLVSFSKTKRLATSSNLRKSTCSATTRSSRSASCENSCCRKTIATVAQPKQLVSKFTMNAVK